MRARRSVLLGIEMATTGMSSLQPATEAATMNAQRRIGSAKLSGQGTERYYFSGIARVTKKKPESHSVWYSDANSGSRDGTFGARARQ